MVTVTLVYQLSDYETGLQSYDLVATAGQALDMSDKIFVFQDIPDSSPVFIGVADPVDLLDYPEDEPDLENQQPFYRLNTVTLRYRSYEEAQDVQQRIDQDVRDLVRSLNNVPTQEITVVY
jgi:hypothetical protein